MRFKVGDPVVVTGPGLHRGKHGFIMQVIEPSAGDFVYRYQVRFSGWHFSYLLWVRTYGQGVLIMICRFAALSLAALFTIPARAQDFVVAQNQTEERPAGLLALPEIFGDYPCESITPKKVNLYATASKERSPIAVIERLNAPKADGPDCEVSEVVVRRLSNGTTGKLPTDESGYEYSKAVVYQQSGNWFRIAIPQGSAW
jgi:hypothetical protein